MKRGYVPIGYTCIGPRESELALMSLRKRSVKTFESCLEAIEKGDRIKKKKLSGKNIEKHRRFSNLWCS